MVQSHVYMCRHCSIFFPKFNEGLLRAFRFALCVNFVIPSKTTGVGVGLGRDSFVQSLMSVLSRFSGCIMCGPLSVPSSARTGWLSPAESKN